MQVVQTGSNVIKRAIALGSAGASNANATPIGALPHRVDVSGPGQSPRIKYESRPAWGHSPLTAHAYHDRSGCETAATTAISRGWITGSSPPSPLRPGWRSSTSPPLR
jgi:hypothetical protein